MIRTAAATTTAGAEEARRSAPREGSAATKVKRRPSRPEDRLGAHHSRMGRRSKASAGENSGHGVMEPRRVEPTPDPLGCGPRSFRGTRTESLLHHRSDTTGGGNRGSLRLALDDRGDV